MHVGIIGAGVFGTTAALTLVDRGWEVTVLDPGPVPHPDAASTDLSKLIRADYGQDQFYSHWMLEAMAGWRAWNRVWSRPLFHEVGMLVMGADLARSGFEGDSFRTLSKLGLALQRCNPSERFEQWRGFVDGYVNPVAGWAESGAVVSELMRMAVDRGVVHCRVRVTALSSGPTVRSDQGSQTFDRVVVAAGTWTPQLLPELGDRLASVGQPVLHFGPAEAGVWGSPDHLPWAADIGQTGWYGFPANQQGIVKVANHGAGRVLGPTEPRVVSEEWEERCRSFLRAHLPSLAEAPLVGSRLCLYSDSFDGDFFIDEHPDRPGVVVASGGSGHGFKFAPVLGSLIADVVEQRPHPARQRTAWRAQGERRTEAARFSG